MKLLLCVLFLASALAALAAAPATAPASPTLKLASIFGDNMVLQREKPLPVWGWATPGATVTVTLDAQKATTVAGTDGAWKVVLKAGKAGGPYSLTVSDGAATLTRKNVMLGEVWLCSGQSNMEMGVNGVLHGSDEVANADHPNIRLFTVAKRIAGSPQQDAGGKWVECSPKTVGGFSAVGYFFGRELQETVHVPIGLINASWGGTTAEAWSPRAALEANPLLKPILGRLIDSPEFYKVAQADYTEKLARYWDDNRPHDTGLPADLNPWLAGDGYLGSMTLPTAVMHSDPSLYMLGAFWFRREVEIPAAWEGHPLTLNLGPITDFDTTFFNGVQVGATNTFAEETAKVVRSYPVPAALVKAGKAVIAVRVFAAFGEGGFTAKPEQFTLTCDMPGAKPLPLAGPWRYGLERSFQWKSPPRGPEAPDSPNGPTRLWNGMIAPLVPYALRGVIWYQGEANGEYGDLYRTLFPAMITGWRQAWGDGDFPFLYVQLANWLRRQEVPSDCTWAELREAQARTLSLPHTGMAVAIDVGEALDIHPKNKQAVGHRLALIARANVYRQRRLEYSGPVYHSMRIEGHAIRLHFDHAKGLVARDGALTGFAIAGADRRFVWADARIVRNTVVVSSPQVPAPVAVRYAWHYNPACNLYNKAGLPAVPFRTDDWPMLSANVR
jgi:sialate O-acetylesterase